ERQQGRSALGMGEEPSSCWRRIRERLAPRLPHPAWIPLRGGGHSHDDDTCRFGDTDALQWEDGGTMWPSAPAARGVCPHDAHRGWVRALSSLLASAVDCFRRDNQSVLG